MAAHLVTVDVVRPGELRLMHPNGQCGIRCLLDEFAGHWGITPSAQERDLAHIAVAIYAADRIVKRPSRVTDTGRHIQLRVGVIDGQWIESSFIERLCELVGFISGDEWDIQLCAMERTAELPNQKRFDFAQRRRPRICLYSGGLDSATGLAIRRNESDAPWLAVTVGHQSGIRHRVLKQLQAQREQRPDPLVMTPLVAGLRKPPHISKQEKSQRTRAVLFCVAAGLAAKWSSVEEVEVFENGVGAFNLPLMNGMLHSGLSTRGAHPRFLAEIGDILGSALGHPLNFVLPFCWDTKAEMLQRLPAAQATGLIELSHSCVHTSIREPGKDHCGVCLACIERKITVAAAGLLDTPSRYQYVDERTSGGMPDEAEHYVYLRGWRAHGAIDKSEDYRALQNNYMRACSIRLRNRQRREFDRLMRRDGKACLAWSSRNRSLTNDKVASYEH